MIALVTLNAAAVLFSSPGHDIHPKQFSTVHGKEYRDCEVLKVDPNGVTFRHDRGMAKVEFKQMPKHLQDRYFYNPKVAKEFIQKFNIPSKEALKRHLVLRNVARERIVRKPYGVYRDPQTGLIGIATNPATPFYNSPYSNVSISDQLYQNHFSRHVQRAYGGARKGGTIIGPRLYPWIRNTNPRQLGTFGAGPSGGSIVPSARSGFSTGGSIAPSMAPARRP